jgi:hypothetical protein
MDSRSTPAPVAARVATFLAQPPLALEITLWVLLVAATIGMRIYLCHLLPAYFWSDDGNSYAGPAFRWLDTGELVFDGRRGPIYTLLIAFALNIFHSVLGVIWIQHALNVLAILFTVAAARIWWGRASALPLFACGMALALYGLPLHMGHLVRNETMLFFFSSVALSAWWLALKFDRLGWFFLAALATTLLGMTKNVFVVFPLVMVAGVLVFCGPGWRARGMRLAMVVAGLALPIVALKIHDLTARRVAIPEPQAGILFFGRTAQWTKLDGGIEQDLKEVIRADIEDYRNLGKLDNNIIIKRTAVPHLWKVLQARKQTPADLDRLCRKFAMEAIRDQPKAFADQVLGDLDTLHEDKGVKNEFPSTKEIIDARKSLREYAGPNRRLHPTMDGERMDAILAEHEPAKTFDFFHDCLDRSWLFQGTPAWHKHRLSPVFFTGAALLIVIGFTRGKGRFFFLGIAAVWFSNMVLLSTVGRPLERYLMPLVPIMFWAMSGAILVAWRKLLEKAGGLTPPPASPNTSVPQET